MTVIMIVLAALVVLGPLIALHEWGHYFVARLCGVKVLTYSIGFGPKLLSWTSKKTGINYAFSAVPLGGYVKMLDEREGEVPANERHLAFNTQKPWKKIAIVAAGPIMNLLIAVVLFSAIFMIPKEDLATKIGSIIPDSPVATTSLKKDDEVVAIDGKAVQSWEDVNFALADRMGEDGNIAVTVKPANHPQSETTVQVPIEHFMQTADNRTTGKDTMESLGILPWLPTIPAVIDSLDPNGAGAKQGLKKGDTITAMNGKPINDWITMSRTVRAYPEQTIQFSVLRDGKNLTLPITPASKKTMMGAKIGVIGAGNVPVDNTIPADYKKTVVYSPLGAIKKAYQKTEYVSMMTLKSFGKMVTGQVSLDNISGPITIAKVAHQSFNIGWEAVLSFMGLISLSLAVMNLLPIPVLDGGHIVMYLYEAVRGKPLPEQAQEWGMKVGLALLACFMLLAVGNDVSRLF